MTGDLRQIDFTSRGVYRGTAAVLDEIGKGRQLEMVVVDRYSVADGTGIHRQVQATRLMFGDHGDTAKYAAIDPGLFDVTAGRRASFQRSMTELGHTGRVVLKRDLWPSEMSDEVIGTVTLVGQTLFLRIESSGSKRSIKNIVGTDHNAYSLLVWSATMHLDSPKLTRWSDDVHRAGRDALAMKTLVDAHKDRGKRMQFGLNEFDPQDTAQAMLLALLCEMGEQDNEARAIKMFGAKSSQLLAGRVAIAESRLPHGVFHLRQERVTLRGSEYVTVKDTFGIVPTWDSRYEAPIAAAVEKHAQGAPYADIGMVLAEYNVERRSTRLPQHLTFGDIAADRDLTGNEKRAFLAGAAKTFLTPHGGRRGNWVPHPEHPAFDRERTALLHSKLTLWETGYWHTQLRLGAVRGLGRTVKGHQLRYEEEADSGWILIPAPLFVDEHGSSTINVGLESEVWAASRERLSSEKMKRVSTGGASHRRQHGRLLTFETWYDGDFDPNDPPRDPSGEVVDHGIRHYRVATRGQGKGSQLNRLLRARPARMSVKAQQGGGQRGWGVTEGEILATFNEAELCHALSSVVENEVATVIDQLRPVVLLPRSVDESSPNDGMRRRQISELEAIIDELKRDHKALRLESARRALAIEDLNSAGSLEERQLLHDALDLLRSDEAQIHQELIDRGRELDKLRGETDQSGGAMEGQSDREVQVATDMGEIAWWIAGLRRTPDGTGSAAMIETTARVAREWRLAVSADGSQVHWSCNLVWPDLSEGTLRLQLNGTVPNRRQHRRPRATTGQSRA